MTQTHQFRKVFITQPSHSFQALFPYSARLVFLSSGDEGFHETLLSIAESLEEFDPEQDAIIAVGKVNSNLALGTLLAQRYSGQTVTIGIYDQGDYQWAKMQL